MHVDYKLGKGLQLTGSRFFNDSAHDATGIQRQLKKANGDNRQKVAIK